MKSYFYTCIKYMFNQEESNEINKILYLNKIDDLKKFIKTRNLLNNYNFYSIYIFYLLQSSGILITTIGTGYNMKNLIWVGVGLNSIASLINIYEKINNNISQRLLTNITHIKDGTYLDEDLLIIPDEDNKMKS